MANKRIAVLVALEGADEGLKRALNSAQQSLGELATSAKTAGDKAARGMAEVKAGMSAFGDQVATLRYYVESMGGKLELVAQFPNHHLVVIEHFGVEKAVVRRHASGGCPGSTAASVAT